MNFDRSVELLGRARKLIPGGVNSPVRAFRSVGGSPLFIARGEGARLIDEDGNSFLDYIGSWGPLILGHRPPCVIDALREVLEIGTSFGAPTEREILLAEAVRDAFPSMEMMRLVNSGTEATMSALRVARGFTRRDLTIKFEGCYHGHADSLLVKAGSGLATLGLSDSAGVPASFAATTISVPYNDLAAVEQAFAKHPGQIACIILEVVAGNMGCVPPAPGFLAGLRELCTRHGTLLIFDEVMTGFRLAYGGAQALYGVKPDMTALGKIIGGGLPIAAYGGRAEIMMHVAPEGPIYQAGTLSGNPLAVSAGLAMLRYLKAHPEVYAKIEALSARLCANPPAGITVNRVGSMFTWFFTSEPVTDYASAKKCDTQRFGEFFHWMLQRGVYLAPSQFEAAFISSKHDQTDLELTLNAAREAFKVVAAAL